MDQTLLQKREAAPVSYPENGITDPQPPQNPTGITATRDESGAIEYRELEVERPKAPLRMTINPPLEYDGQKFTVLIFDFDAMIGKDFQRAEREFNKLYKPDKDEMVLPEMKHLYHQIIAAHRANVPLGVIQKLPRRYYTPLRVEVLKACGSSPDEDKA
jgi:hypothetical protein